MICWYRSLPISILYLTNTSLCYRSVYWRVKLSMDIKLTLNCKANCCSRANPQQAANVARRDFRQFHNPTHEREHHCPIFVRLHDVCDSVWRPPVVTLEAFLPTASQTFWPDVFRHVINLFSMRQVVLTTGFHVFLASLKIATFVWMLVF